jgi:hypothetical protein
MLCLHQASHYGGWLQTQYSVCSFLAASSRPTHSLGCTAAGDSLSPKADVDVLVEDARKMAVEVEHKVASANVFADQVLDRPAAGHGKGERARHGRKLAFGGGCS